MLRAAASSLSPSPSLTPSLRCTLVGLALLSSFATLACGGGDDELPPTKKASSEPPAQELYAESTATSSANPTPAASQATTDAGAPPAVVDAGSRPVDASIGAADAGSGPAPGDMCRILGRCCARVTSCSDETLACIRVVMADNPITCGDTLKTYQQAGCDHPVWERVQLPGFAGCPYDPWGGGP